MIPKTSLLIISSKPKVIHYDPPWQFAVWTLNAGYRYVTRVDRLFEMHDYEWRKTVESLPTAYTEEYPHLKVPIYMLDHYDEIPPSVKYPWGLIRNWTFEIAKRSPENLFASTASYMIALALWEGWKHIQVQDFNEMVPSVAQNLSMWYGIAWGMGVDLSVVGDTFMSSEYLYGYEESRYLPERGTWDTGEPVIRKEI